MNEESDQDRSSRSLSLTTGGLTLLSVLLSIGVTVGFSVSGAWWERSLAGVATTVGLTLAVKAFTTSGRGPLAKLANWVIGAPSDDS